ncbi:MAG TPA: hypothetical protein ENH56_01910 [Roseobacter sp.]|uniref:Uncharacterized protein n=1 Tax=marine sediment metagenome TaxID=412755 RepID=A0A0F9TL71_9ZZZZ|nr:hypothetical protein [Roseobacter sp.]|tara:strand:- start:866 stop:1135 length:270 start_codon:yes stop_codon:yes gene_type:complete
MTKTNLCAEPEMGPLAFSTFVGARALWEVLALRLLREIPPKVFWTNVKTGVAQFRTLRAMWLGRMLTQSMRCPVSGKSLNLRIVTKEPA